MYDFVDRPIDQLNQGGATVLHAMRLWVRRAANGQCACAELRHLFTARGFGAGVGGFGAMMHALHGGARRNVSFRHVGCPRIGEDEAVLLALIRPRCGRAGGARDEAAQMLVCGARLPQFRAGLEALAQGMEQAGGPPRIVGGCHSRREAGS